MQKTIKYIIYSAITLLVSLSVTVAAIQSKHCKQYKKLVNEQIAVIDSLVAIPRNSTTVQLFVTDKSTTKLNAKKSSGTITFPNAKVYELKLDSVSLKGR